MLQSSPLPDGAKEAKAATEDRPTLVIAGATGFVGHHLIARLARRFRIVALTRSASRPVVEDDQSGSDVRWRHCDLFSLEQVTQGLEGAEYALYLVHSMLPGSRLTQARFEDLDLLLADNFARASAARGLRQIVYLGGLLGSVEDGPLSRHLESRREVGDCLASYGTPVTALRAGLIVGSGGTSLRMLVNLVRRLPVMILPRWTRSRTQVIAIADVVRAFETVLGNEDYLGGTYDLGHPEIISYKALIERTAAVLGRKLRFVGVPIHSTRISELWVRLFSGAPAALVGPLIESLRHDMLVRPNPLNDLLAPGMAPFEEALRLTLDERGHVRPSPRATFRPRDKELIHQASLVLSVQRSELHAGWTARRAADCYGPWLERTFRGLLRCQVDDRNGLAFRLSFPRLSLLELDREVDAATTSRQVFRIRGGCLLRRKADDGGQLEFREVLGGRWLITAILDYAPSLPWYIYICSQALMHRFVMWRFRRFLQSQASQPIGNAASRPIDTAPRAIGIDPGRVRGRSSESE